MKPRGGGEAAALRCFVAFEIDASLRASIGAALPVLAPRFAGVRWVADAGLHLTLRFLGATPPERLPELERALAQAACACPAVGARAAGLGIFPGRGAPRVLWLGIELPAPALALQAACERAARAAGFPPEARPFRPHLTLGRWRRAAPRPDPPALDLGTTRLTTLALVRSQLRPQGAVYTPLARFPLAGA